MKTTLGVGISVLSALAAQGKDFDRTELNAMLDQLAASPEPKNTIIHCVAMCYVRSIPKPEDYKFICRTCGHVTLYKEDRTLMRSRLERLRDSVAKLKGMGLDIALDESVLCEVCGKGRIPVRGEVVKEPEDESARREFPWKKGDKVAIRGISGGIATVGALTDVLWVHGEGIDDEGQIMRPNVRVRIRPDVESAVVNLATKGEKCERLPRQDGDPEAWVRIRLPKWQQNDAGIGELKIDASLIGNFTYDDAVCNANRMHYLDWIITGNRVRIKDRDVDLLTAFLSGSKIIDVGARFNESLKSSLPRLRQLLQGEPEALYPTKKDRELSGKDCMHDDHTQSVEVEVDI